MRAIAAFSERKNVSQNIFTDGTIGVIWASRPFTLTGQAETVVIPACYRTVTNRSSVKVQQDAIIIFFRGAGAQKHLNRC